MTAAPTHRSVDALWHAYQDGSLARVQHRWRAADASEFPAALIDTLIARGCLARDEDGARVRLTPRGRETLVALCGYG